MDRCAEVDSQGAVVTLDSRALDEVGKARPVEQAAAEFEGSA
jgi:hypothetical protein